MIRIIIPAYNEAKNIAKSLEDVSSILKKVPHLFYVVNDGSTDATRKILSKLSRRLHIVVLNHKTNKGVSEAFWSGLRAVVKDGRKEDVIVIMEGDGTSDPDILLSMIKRIKKGGDIVIASRYRKGGKYLNFPFKREVFSKAVNFTLRLLFPSSQVSDYTIFYRAYSFTILTNGFDVYKNKLITTQDFVSNAELLINLMKLTNRISEVAFEYDYAKKQGESGMKVANNIKCYLMFLMNSKIKLGLLKKILLISLVIFLVLGLVVFGKQKQETQIVKVDHVAGNIEKVDEKVTLFLKFQGNDKVDYYQHLVEKRLKELEFVVVSDRINDIEPTASRYTTYLGYLTSMATSRELTEKKDELLAMYDEHKEILMSLQNNYEHDSGWWLAIQWAIDSTGIFSEKLKAL